MPKPRKSWREKLGDNKGLPKVEEITDKMSKRWGDRYGCPITSGIFACIAARAAEEAAAEGKKTITPYWRALKSRGNLMKNIPAV